MITTTKDQRMVSIAEKLTDKEMQLFLELLRVNKAPKEEIEYLMRIHDSKDLKVFGTIADKGHLENNLVRNLYKKELDKIVFLSNNEQLLGKLDGLKILLKGPSGTGKTTFAKIFIETVANKFAFEEINFEQLISHKMGQTQNNLIKLRQRLSARAERENLIVFIDEIDSIVISRENENDIGEHSRIIASFLKFFDSLPKNIIIVAATNVSKKIDSALLRRFNVKIDGKFADQSYFLKELEQEYAELFSDRKFSSIFKDKSCEFKVSEINDFINDFEIERSIHENIELFALFCIKFQEKLGIDFEKLPVRTMKNVARMIKND